MVHNHASCSEKGYTPEDRHVIKFFPIFPSIEPRRFLYAHNPTDMLECLKKVFLAGQQRIRALDTFRKAPPINLDKNVYDVNAQ
jgi:hypothetical protein